MATLQGRRIALIGGAGFIGHNLAMELARSGAEVHVVDSLQVNNLLTFATGQDNEKRDMNLKVLHNRKSARLSLVPHVNRDYRTTYVARADIVQSEDCGIK